MTLSSLNGGVLYEATSTGSGSGNYDTFLQLQATGTEEGFNHDQQQNILDTQHAFTNSITFGSISTVTIGNVEYVEFRLDLNESDNRGNPAITLADLKIYVSGSPAALSDFNGASDQLGAGFNLVYDLSGSVNLTDTNTGSGTDDYRFLVPVSLFTDQGATASSYVTLYSLFTGTNSGFEEWRVQTKDTPPADPQITIDKVTIDQNGGAPGDGISIITGEEITWQYTITNSGNVDLTGIVVVDDNGTAATGDDVVVGTIALLAAGGSQILTLDDIAGTGSYSNVATATGTYGGSTVSATDGSSYFGIYAHLTLAKVTVDELVEGDGITILSGEAISWKYTVTNDGNVTLTNIDVVDDNGTADTDDDVLVGTIASLAAGDSATLYVEGEAGQGAYSNVAIATADPVTDSAGHAATASGSDGSSYFGIYAHLTLAKVTVDELFEGDGITILSGEAISWKYTVTNNGNVTLTNIDVVDDNGTADTEDDVLVGTITSLAAGDSATLYVEGEAQRGAYSNTATATADAVSDDAEHEAIASDADDSSYFGADPSLSIDKVTVDDTAEGDGLVILSGEDIRWRYSVTNTGNVALAGLAVTDDQAGVMPTYVSGDANNNSLLDLTETWIFEASGTSIVGNYSNVGTATASFTDSADHSVSVDDTDGSSYFGANPQINIAKSTQDLGAPNGVPGDGITVLVGETIQWIYTVTNGGNVALSDIQVLDSDLGDIDANADTVLIKSGGDTDDLLEDGETWTYTLAGTATAGAYSNTGTASGSFTDDAGHTGTGKASDDSSYFGADPSLSIDKVTVDDTAEGDGLVILSGEDIRWRYSVTNTGNVALAGLAVTDDQAGVMPTYVSGDANNNSLLDLTETWIYEASGTSIVGNYSNTGTATASFTDSAGHADEVSDTDGSSYFGASTGIDIQKVTNGAESVVVRLGDALTWTYTVKNTGNVALSNVGIVDDHGTAGNAADDFTLDYSDLVSGDADNDHALDTDETWVFEATGTASVAEYKNTAKASGDFTDDAEHTDTASDTDTSSYLMGPGVRTPGFWSNLGVQFWDGAVGNETKAGNSFPLGELLGYNDLNGAAAGTGNTGAYLILGGDHDSTLEAGELQVSLKDALSLLNASQKQQQDGRWMLARDVVATELNLRAGNLGTDADDETVDPQHLLDDAVAWLRLTTNGDQLFLTSELNSGKVGTNDAIKWSTPYAGVDHAASVLHTQLDIYNNTGYVFGVKFANDGDLF